MTETGSTVERLRELEAATIKGPWLSFGSEVSTSAVDIVRWSYVDMPPATWDDAAEHAARICDFIAESRNALPALLAVVEAAQEASQAYWDFHNSDASTQDVRDSLNWLHAKEVALYTALAALHSQASDEGKA